MTVARFRKKAEVARRYGRALLEDGSILYYDGAREFKVEDREGNTVDIAADPMKLAYLVE